MSVSTGAQIFMAASMLYGLGLFVASATGTAIAWTILVSGVVIIFYCVVGGLWAVVITDFLQAVVLLPFTLVLAELIQSGKGWAA